MTLLQESEARSLRLPIPPRRPLAPRAMRAPGPHRSLAGEAQKTAGMRPGRPLSCVWLHTTIGRPGWWQSSMRSRSTARYRPPSWKCRRPSRFRDRFCTADRSVQHTRCASGRDSPRRHRTSSRGSACADAGRSGDRARHRPRRNSNLPRPSGRSFGTQDLPVPVRTPGARPETQASVFRGRPLRSRNRFPRWRLAVLGWSENLTVSPGARPPEDDCLDTCRPIRDTRLAAVNVRSRRVSAECRDYFLLAGNATSAADTIRRSSAKFGYFFVILDRNSAAVLEDSSASL